MPASIQPIMLSTRRDQVFEDAHESVLLAESLTALDLHDGQVVIDATTGQGGHSEAILKAAKVTLVALDADPMAVAHTRERLAPFGPRAQVIEANFRNMTAALAGVGISRADRVLFDLGWNRGQLTAGRGFSFQADEPLNMSYGPVPQSGFTAADILNTWSQEAIANVLFGYGGERYARRVAANVVAARTTTPIETTGRFVSIIERSVPAFYRRGRTHAATKSFQALRIAVNDELGSLQIGLRAAWDLLAPGGRMAVITFHSLEDGLVKRTFADFAAESGELISRKPIASSRMEIARNRASRSAKLRGIIKK